MKDTKITVKVTPWNLKLLNTQLSDCCIKRDAFIENLIEIETPKLALEMADKRQSTAAKRYISGELKRKGPKVVNMKISQSTAQQLNEVVSQCNMVRDAFINRLIFLLTAPTEILTLVDLPGTISEAMESTNYVNASLPTSPLAAIQEIVADPFFHFRAWLDEPGLDGIYLRHLSDKLPYLACYMEDVNVPGTKEFLALKGDMDLEAFIRSMQDDDYEGPDHAK